jgi:hypothetical protein
MYAGVFPGFDFKAMVDQGLLLFDVSPVSNQRCSSLSDGGCWAADLVEQRVLLSILSATGDDEDEEQE